jgi:type IV pilus assembly protein PilX
MNTNKRQQMPGFSRRTPTHRTGSHEQGAVLVVGLIILIVLTLLGVQAMRSNVSQERMASNMRERNVAFQAAEAALRVGEFAGPFDESGVDLVDPVNWVAGEETGTLTNFDAGLTSDPVYQIGPPQYVRVGISLPAKYRFIYPVSSRGEGGQAGSIVVLRSGFEPAN